ncbi:DUF4350 domain-containing protein [Pseudomonas sp. NPDC007930]|uniref:DUF4350 domain-containing protein n=1 Tax=Pseudomonas sp. NPDC007930 TaxID=3364417 RepID=UPI0036E720DF
MKARRLALVLLASIALAAAGYYLWAHLERVEETVDHGPSEAARNNPYLAAERFLRGQGLAVSPAGGGDPWAGMAPASSSLVLLADRRGMSAPQVQRLLQWVRRGGHLVVVAQGIYNAQRGRSGDALLDTLRIRRTLSKDLPEAAQASQDKTPDLTQLYLENEPAPALLGFDPAFHLEDPTDKAMAWANSRIATHLMQLDWGDGVITVLSDAALWRNGAIGKHDNAWLLWYLNQDRKVTLVQQAQPQGWFSLLWQYFAQALVALLALALAACWYHGVRTGPALPAPPPGRRRLAEHLRASAAFTLRHGGQQQLLKHLRRDLGRRAARHHPGFAQLPVADQWHVLARLAGVPTASIAQAMAPSAGKRLSSGAFNQQVAQLQRIRNAL